MRSVGSVTAGHEPMNIDKELYEREGYLILRRLLSTDDVHAGLLTSDKLHRQAAPLTRSKGDFNVETPKGGFISQDGSAEGYRGVLRKVSNVVQHSATFATIASRTQLHDIVSTLLVLQPHLL